MCTRLNPRDVITTGDDRPTEKMRQTSLRATDVPLGDGLAGAARQSILTRRERLRIAEEGK